MDGTCHCSTISIPSTFQGMSVYQVGGRSSDEIHLSNYGGEPNSDRMQSASRDLRATLCGDHTIPAHIISITIFLSISVLDITIRRSSSNMWLCACVYYVCV